MSIMLRTWAKKKKIMSPQPDFEAVTSQTPGRDID